MGLVMVVNECYLEATVVVVVMKLVVVRSR